MKPSPKAYVVQYSSGIEEGVVTDWSDEAQTFPFDPKLVRHEQAARRAAKALRDFLVFEESLAPEPWMQWRVVIRSTEDREVIV